MANTLAPDAGSTVTPSASVPSSEPPIYNEIGALFGDLTEEEDRDESPEQPSADAGAPPADATAATPESAPQAGAESANLPSAAGAPPANADGSVPLDDPQLLADAKPLTYTVNGQERTFEGLELLGEHGAIITAEHLPKLVRVLTERDNLFERDQERYQQQQQWERERAEFDRLTEWKQGDQTLKGPDGILAQRASAAGITAALQTLVQAFKDNPVRYLSQDEHGNIIWNPEAIERLTLRSQIAERAAVDSVRSQFQSVRSQVQQQTAQTQQEAPQEMWRQVHEAWVKPQTGLTDKDQEFLASQMPFYIRDASPQEIAAGSMRRVVDPSFQQVIADRAALRAEQAKTAQATQQAAAQNAARLAAAAIAPTRPAAATPTAPTQSPKNQRAKDDAAAWRMMENAANGRFTHSSE